MKALTEFHNDIVAIYGYGLQVSVALSQWHQFLNGLTLSGNTNADNRLSFGQSDPNDRNATYTYRRSIGSLVDASSPNGTTSVIHRRNLISLLDACWEDRYRERIAKEAGLGTKDDLCSDLFRDVRMYRNSILHANARLTGKPRTLCFFCKGDTIALTGEHLDTLFRMTIDELNRIAKDHFGTIPGFSFEQPLGQ